ncbi:uncharacterized protein VICG_00753 [Vittaforma corneae ATCC 50505]|uniref:DUF5094 domain-containing protein n=1 Tax=Vittaforma corneae (strain ATCC 50505) TaxID=993615 RepID=L2GP88_VITCO|nr:uncharacterized protein VICG_00753 [Vittaforma corneae ATCC 50505]ELA42112.1 hypothetical protein VICG_00753 [Vittaforma corneae ATCC 50505]
MAHNKKRTLTFQTPKKKAMTPLRIAKETASTSSTHFSDTERDNHMQPAITSTSNNISTSLENKLIEAYREENSFLRNLKSDVLLYTKLLGITIDQDGSFINFSIQRTSTTGKKKLGFTLEEAEQNYIFTLKESENCNVPEYFYDVIEFDKKVFPQFFYKAMQAVYETRSNE